MTTQIQALKRNAKFISYILGHRPDEFGLVTDERGFVKIKTLLKAVHEEPNWRFLRPTHLQEMTLSLKAPPVEIKGALIRSTGRSNLPCRSAVSQPPKLFYSAVRRRAYPMVLEKGIPPSGDGYVVLTSDKAMADRLGKRIDSEPVILTVQSLAAQSRGVCFQQYGQSLYLTDYVPTGTFSGPPLPKEREKRFHQQNKPAALPPVTSGGYLPDMVELKKSGPGASRRHEKKEKAWHKERRQARKQKQRGVTWSE